MLDTTVYQLLDGLVSCPVQMNVISENQSSPYVWFQRRVGNVELLLGGGTALADTSYDVECIGTDIDAVATIADTLKTALNGYQAGVILAAFVEDADDEYIVKGIDTDSNDHVFAFSLRILS